MHETIHTLTHIQVLGFLVANKIKIVIITPAKVPVKF